MKQKLIYKLAINPFVNLTDIGMGEENEKDSSPVVGQVFIATDTEKIYVCEVAGIWTEWAEDNIRYDPVNNRFEFYINNVKVADLDGDGKLRVKTIEEVTSFS